MYAAQAGNLDAVTFLINKGSNTEQQRKVRNDYFIFILGNISYTHTWSYINCVFLNVDAYISDPITHIRPS
jgi:hypothetical protein